MVLDYDEKGGGGDGRTPASAPLLNTNERTSLPNNSSDSFDDERPVRDSPRSDGGWSDASAKLRRAAVERSAVNPANGKVLKKGQQQTSKLGKAKAKPTTWDGAKKAVAKTKPVSASARASRVVVEKVNEEALFERVRATQPAKAREAEAFTRAKRKMKQQAMSARLADGKSTKVSPPTATRGVVAGPGSTQDQVLSALLEEEKPRLSTTAAALLSKYKNSMLANNTTSYSTSQAQSQRSTSPSPAAKAAPVAAASAKRPSVGRSSPAPAARMGAPVADFRDLTPISNTGSASSSSAQQAKARGGLKASLPGVASSTKTTPAASASRSAAIDAKKSVASAIQRLKQQTTSSGGNAAATTSRGAASRTAGSTSLSTSRPAPATSAAANRAKQATSPVSNKPKPFGGRVLVPLTSNSKLAASGRMRTYRPDDYVFRPTSASSEDMTMDTDELFDYRPASSRGRSSPREDREEEQRDLHTSERSSRARTPPQQAAMMSAASTAKSSPRSLSVGSSPAPKTRALINLPVPVSSSDDTDGLQTAQYSARTPGRHEHEPLSMGGTFNVFGEVAKLIDFDAKKETPRTTTAAQQGLATTSSKSSVSIGLASQLQLPSLEDLSKLQAVKGGQDQHRILSGDTSLQSLLSMPNDIRSGTGAGSERTDTVAEGTVRGEEETGSSSTESSGPHDETARRLLNDSRHLSRDILHIIAQRKQEFSKNGGKKMSSSSDNADSSSDKGARKRPKSFDDADMTARGSRGSDDAGSPAIGSKQSTSSAGGRRSRGSARSHPPLGSARSSRRSKVATSDGGKEDGTSSSEKDGASPFGGPTSSDDDVGVGDATIKWTRRESERMEMRVEFEARLAQQHLDFMNELEAKDADIKRLSSLEQRVRKEREDFLIDQHEHKRDLQRREQELEHLKTAEEARLQQLAVTVVGDARNAYEEEKRQHVAAFERQRAEFETERQDFQRRQAEATELRKRELSATRRRLAEEAQRELEGQRELTKRQLQDETAAHQEQLAREHAARLEEHLRALSYDEQERARIAEEERRKKDLQTTLEARKSVTLAAERERLARQFEERLQAERLRLDEERKKAISLEEEARKRRIAREEAREAELAAEREQVAREAAENLEKEKEKIMAQVRAEEMARKVAEERKRDEETVAARLKAEEDRHLAKEQELQKKRELEEAKAALEQRATEAKRELEERLAKDAREKRDYEEKLAELQRGNERQERERQRFLQEQEDLSRRLIEEKRHHEVEQARLLDAERREKEEAAQAFAERLAGHSLEIAEAKAKREQEVEEQNAKIAAMEAELRSQREAANSAAAELQREKEELLAKERKEQEHRVRALEQDLAAQKAAAEDAVAVEKEKRKERLEREKQKLAEEKEQFLREKEAALAQEAAAQQAGLELEKQQREETLRKMEAELEAAREASAAALALEREEKENVAREHLRKAAEEKAFLLQEKEQALEREKREREEHTAAMEADLRAARSANEAALALWREEKDRIAAEHLQKAEEEKAALLREKEETLRAEREEKARIQNEHARKWEEDKAAFLREKQEAVAQEKAAQAEKVRALEILLREREDAKDQATKREREKHEERMRELEAVLEQQRRAAEAVQQQAAAERRERQRLLDQLRDSKEKRRSEIERGQMQKEELRTQAVRASEMTTAGALKSPREREQSKRSAEAFTMFEARIVPSSAAEDDSVSSDAESEAQREKDGGLSAIKEKYSRLGDRIEKSTDEDLTSSSPSLHVARVLQNRFDEDEVDEFGTPLKLLQMKDGTESEVRTQSRIASTPSATSPSMSKHTATASHPHDSKATHLAGTAAGSKSTNPEWERERAQWEGSEKADFISNLASSTNEDGTMLGSITGTNATAVTGALDHSQTTCPAPLAGKRGGAGKRAQAEPEGEPGANVSAEGEANDASIEGGDTDSTGDKTVVDVEDEDEGKSPREVDITEQDAAARSFIFNMITTALDSVGSLFGFGLAPVPASPAASPRGRAPKAEGEAIPVDLEGGAKKPILGKGDSDIAHYNSTENFVGEADVDEREQRYNYGRYMLLGIIVFLMLGVAVLTPFAIMGIIRDTSAPQKAIVGPPGATGDLAAASSSSASSFLTLPRGGSAASDAAVVTTYRKKKGLLRT